MRKNRPENFPGCLSNANSAFHDGVENAGVLVSVNTLSSLASNSASQLDVLSHDGNTLGVDGSQVGVLKETDEVSLSSLLESENSAGLESEISLEVLSDFSDESLEGKLSD